MVETKPFKTKLCVLYQRGRCGRQTCTFAHGDSELRRFSGSFAGGTTSLKCLLGISLNSGVISHLFYADDIYVATLRLERHTFFAHYYVTHVIPWDDRRDNRNFDLRSKLDRRRSPLHRYSPGKDTRGWHVHQRFRPLQHIKRRKYGRIDDMDSQSEMLQHFKGPDGASDRGKDKHLEPSDSRNFLDDELKQVQFEIDELSDQKGRLEVALHERIQEADILSSRIRDLEVQLCEEKDRYKRINSKIKKLIRAHVHRIQLQDELKRSQVQLQKLVEELRLDAGSHFGSEDNSNVNIISDEEVHVLDLRREHTSATSKQLQLHNTMEASGRSKLAADIVKGHKVRIDGTSRRKLHIQFNGDGEPEVGKRTKDIEQLQPNESKSKRRKEASRSSASFDKHKVSESAVAAPLTSMAAHAVDDFVDQIEVEEDRAVPNETPAVTEDTFQFPPSKNNSIQYERDDEHVDGDVLKQEPEEVDIV